MKSAVGLILGTVLVCSIGCPGVSLPGHSVQHSSFFTSHNGKACLEAAAKAKGYDLGGGGSGHSLGGATGRKTFSVSIKGDDRVRDALMRDYQHDVEKELNKAGAGILEEGTSGNVSGFDFSYEVSGVAGLVHANAVVGANGFIEFDILLYEHD